MMDGNQCADHALCEDMAAVIDELTTSGEKELNVEKMKKLKKTCRLGDLYVRHAFHLLINQLNEDHSEIRLSAFQIIDELFTRSHVFRQCLVEEFESVMNLTMGIDLQMPLPPPKPTADSLKVLAINTVQKWFDKFGEAYKKLSLGYYFLKDIKKIDFVNVQAATIVEQNRRREREERRQAIWSLKASNVMQEMSDASADIEQCLLETENCFHLLLPHPDSFFISESTNFELSEKPAEIPATKQLSSSPNDANYPATNDTNYPATKELSSSPNDTNCQTNGIGDGDLPASGEITDMAKEFEEPNTSSLVQQHGLGTRTYAIDIVVPDKDVLVKETEDNRDVMDNLKDLYKLISGKYLKDVVRWLEVLTKAGADQAELKKAIDLKMKLEGIKKKYQELKIATMQERTMTATTGSADDDSDDDFIEVEDKPGYEAHVPSHLKTDYSCFDDVAQPKKGLISTQKSWQIMKDEDEADLFDPATMSANRAKFKQKQQEHRQDAIAGNSKSSLNGKRGSPLKNSPKHSPPKKLTESNKEIPTVPYGKDLEHWEHPEDLEAPLTIKFDSLHRFWRPTENEEKITPGDLSAIQTRSIPFIGKFEPVKWMCRAPIENGKLCERMDRYKCPFHGKIIPRDETGQPADSKDVIRILLEREKKQEETVPEWRNPELLREIEAGTGLDLGSGKIKRKGKGKGKGKKSKYPGLTDVKAANNTARHRLESKVFNKRVLSRVNSALNDQDFKRVRDKFGNQFQYTLSK